MAKAKTMATAAAHAPLEGADQKLISQPDYQDRVSALAPRILDSAGMSIGESRSGLVARRRRIESQYRKQSRRGSTRI